ncbi:MAG: membrane protein insertion efficiency factor YidD, partial [Kiritimatiellae bacterium]|nr:membrane protein insertion efficiency factor YidD [Kiritimatiellia bacterium]
AAIAAAGTGDAGAENRELLRRVSLVEQLLEEGAPAEALREARLLRDEPFWRDGALAPIEGKLRLAAAAAQRRDPARPAQPGSGKSAGSRLARAVVAFYRFAVSPAIGQRCSLTPSCSQYFLEASRKHGLLGIPMITDRFVREPVVSAPDRPLVRDGAGRWRHPDPVEDHDWWFEK